jgi:type IV pilus assembly protein PilY1
MGLTYSEPQIARLKYNNKWVAIFGNGYNSVSERAFLYIVDLETGDLIKKIPTNTATSNGLSSVTLYDKDDDKITDAVYAGDLQGNLWEFDLSGDTTSSWSVSNGGQPLFTAVNDSNQAQPITAAPQYTKHSSGGIMLYFGTGRYLAFADVLNKEMQSFYAVWDKPESSTKVNKTDLVAQTIDIQTNIDFTSVDGSTQNLPVRVTSANSVDFDGGKRGWYMNLRPPSPGTVQGERITSQPLVKEDRVIFLTAIPTDDVCKAGGDSWLMELDLISGARTGKSAFDVNGDNKFDEDDELSSMTLSGVKSPDGMGKEPVWLETDVEGVAVKETSVSKGKIWTLKNRSSANVPPAGGGGTVDRLDWQQIQ